MAIYSINDLEKLSGIKAHTLRVWEQRYGIIAPQRTPTNIRYYTDTDLKKLLTISFLNRHGFRISKIAEMAELEMLEHSERLAHQDPENETQIETLTMAMVEMDEVKFEQIVGNGIRARGFEHSMMSFILPFLERINLLWMTGAIKPAQEQFITMLIRQKIIAAIDAIPAQHRPASQRCVIFLPTGERQELSLLFLHYVLRSGGLQPINIGLNANPDDLRTAYELHTPAYFYTFLTEPHKQPVEQRVRALSAAVPEATLLVSGYQVIAHPFALPKNVRVLRDMDETLRFMRDEIVPSSNEPFSVSANANTLTHPTNLRDEAALAPTKTTD